MKSPESRIIDLKPSEYYYEGQPRIIQEKPVGKPKLRIPLRFSPYFAVGTATVAVARVIEQQDVPKAILSTSISFILGQGVYNGILLISSCIKSKGRK